MSAIPYDELKSVLMQLSRQEINLAKKYLLAFDTDGHKNNNKNYQLLEYLDTNPDSNYAKARQYCGRLTDKKSFDQICRRLKDRLSESLILDINLKRNDVTENGQSQRLYVRKKLLIASVMMERGAEREAYSIFHKIVGFAKEHELYNDLYEALYWIRNEGLKISGSSVETINKEIAFYRYCDYAICRSREIYAICNNCTDFTEDYIKLLRDFRIELALLFLNTRSVNIAYYYYLIEVKYYFLTQNYKDGCETGRKLTRLIATHPVLMGDLRLGSAYVELASGCRMLKDYINAVTYAEMALELLPGNGYYYETAKEIQFQGLLFLANYEKSLNSLEALICAMDKKKNQEAYWRRNYYKSCLHLLLGNFNESYRIMERIGKLKTEEECWNIGRKIIGTLCEIELGNYDDADKSIEALRKYLQRNLQAKNTNSHYKNAVKLLILLSRKSYIFEDVKDLIPATFNNENRFSNPVHSPDLRVFVIWLKNKFNAKGILLKLNPEDTSDLPDGMESAYDSVA